MGSVVVLNGSGQYWGDRSIKDVIKLHVKNKVVMVKADESKQIRAAYNRNGNHFVMPIPLVVMLKTFFGCSIKAGPLHYSDDLVYERDQNNCQYWHYDEFGHRFVYKCTANDRTIDHIFPQWRGGADSYENCVCACKTCNIKRKGGRTPKEAGLKLIRTPVEPKIRRGGWAFVSFNYNPENEAHVAYKKYLNELVAA